MATQFHPNGTAEIKVGTGSAGALELLGHSINGVDRDPNIIRYPIYTDACGGDGGVPAAHQRIGQVDRVSADVIVYDESVMAKVRQGIDLIKASLAEGVMAVAGAVLDNGTIGGSGNGGYYRLLITSPLDGRPFNYVSAILEREPVRLSTRVMVYRLSWLAIPYVGTGNTMANITLYNSTTS